uniref:Stanniocalcin n=1 Tax=Monopterus albus TaxID=43700 RepID=A0A3Q3KI08_MONAL
QLVMPADLAVVLFVFVLCLSCQQVDLHDVQEKVDQAKRRLSLQSSAEIQSCLMSSGDVGCGIFQCFNNSCEIHGLHHICITLLHNAGHYDSQGKSYLKDVLRCIALGLSCVSRRCAAVKEMVFSLQRECYSKHQLCLALQDHMDTTGSLVQFHLMFPPGPYVELVNFLLKCGDKVRSWVSQRLRGQCEQHWGALCSSFDRTCSFSHHHPADRHQALCDIATSFHEAFFGHLPEINTQSRASDAGLLFAALEKLCNQQSNEAAVRVCI